MCVSFTYWPPFACFLHNPVQSIHLNLDKTQPGGILLVVSVSGHCCFLADYQYPPGQRYPQTLWVGTETRFCVSVNFPGASHDICKVEGQTMWLGDSSDSIFPHLQNALNLTYLILPFTQEGLKIMLWVSTHRHLSCPVCNLLLLGFYGSSLGRSVFAWNSWPFLS